MTEQFHRGAKIAAKPMTTEDMTYSEMVACFTHWMARKHPEVSTMEVVGLVQVAHRIALTLCTPATAGGKP